MRAPGRIAVDQRRQDDERAVLRSPSRMRGGTEQPGSRASRRRRHALGEIRSTAAQPTAAPGSK
jgi:hypothetical protein